MRHTHHYHEPRFTITQVRSLGMPFGGCKESGTGMEGTRYKTLNKKSSHWNLNQNPNFVCMSCMYCVHCTETRSWCVFVFLFCVHVCLQLDVWQSWFMCIKPFQALPWGVHQRENQLHQDQLKYILLRGIDGMNLTIAVSITKTQIVLMYIVLIEKVNMLSFSQF